MLRLDKRLVKSFIAPPKAYPQASRPLIVGSAGANCHKEICELSPSLLGDVRDQMRNKDWVKTKFFSLTKQLTLLRSD